MLLAESMSGAQIFLLGLAVVVTAWTLRRMQKQRGRVAAPQTIPSEKSTVAGTRRSAESRDLGVIQQAEVRLHDYAREVEGRIETRLAMLDQLVLDADREIARLEDMLETLEKSDPAARLLRRSQRSDRDNTEDDAERAA